MHSPRNLVEQAYRRGRFKEIRRSGIHLFEEWTFMIYMILFIDLLYQEKAIDPKPVS